MSTLFAPTEGELTDLEEFGDPTIEEIDFNERLLKHRTAIRRIDELDLEQIKEKLCLPKENDGQAWSQEKANQAEVWYKRFLKLIVLTSTKEVKLVPSKDIDEVWHTHILHTAKYRRDCNYVCGRYLDHYPYFGLRGQQDHEIHMVEYAKTIACFKAAFGENPMMAELCCFNNCSNCMCGGGK